MRGQGAHSQERLLPSPSSESQIAGPSESDILLTLTAAACAVTTPHRTYCDKVASSYIVGDIRVFPPPLSQTGSEVLQVPSDLGPAHLSCQSQIFSSAPDRIWQVENRASVC